MFRFRKGHFWKTAKVCLRDDPRSGFLYLGDQKVPQGATLLFRQNEIMNPVTGLVIQVRELSRIVGRGSRLQVIRPDWPWKGPKVTPAVPDVSGVSEIYGRGSHQVICRDSTATAEVLPHITPYLEFQKILEDPEMDDLLGEGWLKRVTDEAVRGEPVPGDEWLDQMKYEPADEGDSSV